MAVEYDEHMMNEFIRMTRRQLATSDFDAEHPVCMWIVKKKKLSYEQSLWLSFLYMAYYDEASMWATFENSDPFTVPKNTDYPIGTNRRNLFGTRILRHFASLEATRKVAKDWPTHNFTGDPKKDWKLLNENLGQVWGNGRFAKYTTAEMLQKVCGIKCEITDFDNKNSSGPRDGIQRIYKCEDTLALMDKYGEEIYNRVLKTKLNPTYTKTDRGVVESVLCNFSGLVRGVFYSGRNLDRQQARILRVEDEYDYPLPLLWEARDKVFNHQHLGEFNDWVGIDRDRLTHYQETGEMLWNHENR